jgi:hypothetical protein
VRWFVGLGWLTAAYSAAVLVWMLQPGNRPVGPVAWAPSLAYAGLVPVWGLVVAVLPRRLRPGLKHPGRLVAAAVIAAAALLVSVLVAIAMTPYRGGPAGVAAVNEVESIQRDIVGAALVINLAALMGLGFLADDGSSGLIRHPRLPRFGYARHSGVKLRRRW